MTTYQRRHGLKARVWKVETQTDLRGNKHEVAVPNNPHEVRVWIYPQRSARAELAGQHAINIIRIGVSPNLTGVDLWSKVELQGKLWDIVTPPSYHHGTRKTRHWSIDLRERPEGIEDPNEPEDPDEPEGPGEDESGEEGEVPDGDDQGGTLP